MGWESAGPIRVGPGLMYDPSEWWWPWLWECTLQQVDNTVMNLARALAIVSLDSHDYDGRMFF